MKYYDTKFLDGARIILALWVVVAHFYNLMGGIHIYRFPRIIEDLLLTPAIAVYGFMIITGFLMMYHYELRITKEPAESKLTFLKFWLRRFFRLYPLYVVVLLVAFFSLNYIAKLQTSNISYLTGLPVVLPGDINTQPGFADLLSHLFLIHGFFPDFQGSILGVAWSLSLEMQFYFIFPFLFLLFFKNEHLLQKWVVILLTISVISTIASPIIYHILTTLVHSRDFQHASIITYMLHLFLLGMIMAGVKLKKINALYLIIALMLIIPFQIKTVDLLISLLLIFLFLDELQAVIPNIILKPLKFCRSLLSGKLAEFGANISYSLYLIHIIVIPIAINFMISHAQVFNQNKTRIILASFAATLIACSCISYLLYISIEKPFIALGKKIVDKMTDKKEIRSASQPYSLNSVNIKN
jgi:peptidoglycan/LPS O-acetylase OafA/YrhL